MKKPEKKIKEADIVAAFFKVKPTADMPRPGPTKSKATKNKAKPK